MPRASVAISSGLPTILPWYAVVSTLRMDGIRKDPVLAEARPPCLSRCLERCAVTMQWQDGLTLRRAWISEGLIKKDGLGIGRPH